jgi:hypothetical protein
MMRQPVVELQPFWCSCAGRPKSCRARRHTTPRRMSGNNSASRWRRTSYAAPGHRVPTSS